MQAPQRLVNASKHSLAKAGWTLWIGLSPASKVRTVLVCSNRICCNANSRTVELHWQDSPVEANKKPLVASLLLVAMPFAPSSTLAPSSKARSP